MSVPGVLRTFPITLLGATSIVVLVLTGAGLVATEGVWYLLMLPAYIAHLFRNVVLVAVFEDPPRWTSIVTLPLLLTPFVALDLFFRSLRKDVKSGRTMQDKAQ